MTEEELDDMIMPFGKYKGDRIRALALAEPDYLRWILNNFELREPLKQAIQKALAQ